MSNTKTQALEALRTLLDSHNESVVLKAAELIMIYDQPPTPGRA